MLPQLTAMFGKPVGCSYAGKDWRIWENPTSQIFGKQNIFDKVTFDGKSVLLRTPLYAFPDKTGDIVKIAPGLSFYQDEQARPYVIATNSVDWRLAVISTKLGIDYLSGKKWVDLAALYRMWVSLFEASRDEKEKNYYTEMNYAAAYDMIAPVSFSAVNQPSVKRPYKPGQLREGFQDAWYATDEPWYVNGNPASFEMGTYETGLYSDGSCMTKDDFYLTMKGKNAERMGHITFRMCDKYQRRPKTKAVHPFTIMNIPLLVNLFEVKRSVKVPVENFGNPLHPAAVDALLVRRMTVPSGNPSFAFNDAPFVYDVGNDKQVPRPSVSADPSLYANVYGQ